MLKQKKKKKKIKKKLKKKNRKFYKIAVTEYFLFVSVVPNRLIWGEILEMGHALQLNLSLN